MRISNAAFSLNHENSSFATWPGDMFTADGCEEDVSCLQRHYLFDA